MTYPGPLIKFRRWCISSSPAGVVDDRLRHGAGAEVDEETAPVVSEIGEDVYVVRLVERKTKVALVVLFTARMGDGTWTKADSSGNRAANGFDSTNNHVLEVGSN